jgi:AcrR family transcriptional regulator
MAVPAGRTAQAANWRRFDPVELSPILTGALAAFHEHGYHGTTVRDIAGRVGVTVPALYYHHQSKQGVFLALLDVAMDDLIPRLHAAVSAGGDRPTQQFANLMEALALHMTERVDLASLDSELRYLDSRSRAHYAARRGKVARLLDEILEAGVAEGVFDVAHVPDTTRALLGMQLSIATWYRPRKGGLPPQEIADRYVALSLNAVRAKAPRSRVAAKVRRKSSS